MAPDHLSGLGEALGQQAPGPLPFSGPINGMGGGLAVSSGFGSESGVFTTEELNRLKEDFFQGLETLDQLASQQIDPFETMRREAPAIAQTIRAMAGVETNEAISALSDQNAEQLIRNVGSEVEQLIAQRAEYEQNPNKALMELLSNFIVLAATGQIESQDLQSVIGLLMVNRDRIQQERLQSIDSRIRSIQSSALQWYREYNLAKARQNQPFVQAAMEAARQSTRLTKISVDQANEVFQRHLRLNQQRLDALMKGGQFQLDSMRMNREAFSEWWSTFVRISRFVASLDTEQHGEAKARIWSLFADYTDRIASQFESVGLRSPIPRLTDSDLAQLKLMQNPSVAYINSLVKRTDQDTLRLLAETRQIDLEVGVMQSTIPVRNLGDAVRLYESALSEVDTAASTTTSIENAVKAFQRLAQSVAGQTIAAVASMESQTGQTRSSLDHTQALDYASNTIVSHWTSGLSRINTAVMRDILAGNSVSVASANPMLGQTATGPSQAAVQDMTAIRNTFETILANLNNRSNPTEGYKAATIAAARLQRIRLSGNHNQYTTDAHARIGRWVGYMFATAETTREQWLRLAETRARAAGQSFDRTAAQKEIDRVINGILATQLKRIYGE